MDAARQIAEFLQTFGGWAVAVFLGSVVVYLYKGKEILHEKIYTRVTDLLRETSSLLQQNSDELKRTEALLDRVERKMDKGE